MFQNLTSQVFQGWYFEIACIGNGNMQMPNASNQGFFFSFLENGLSAHHCWLDRITGTSTRPLASVTRGGFIKASVLVRTEANSGKHKCDF